MPKTQKQPSKQLAPSELATVEEKPQETEVSAEEVRENQQPEAAAE